jgi:hypothetical protein
MSDLKVRPPKRGRRADIRAFKLARIGWPQGQGTPASHLGEQRLA